VFVNVTERTTCRACQDNNLTTVLDLGTLAVSDFVTDPTAPLDRAPLELVECGGCGLVQLRHTVDRDRLFRRYFYRSATNEAMVTALRDLAEDAVGRVILERGDHVMDLGCGDGTLLRFLPTHVRRIGVDPSDVADSAIASGATIVHDYWPITRYPVPVVPQMLIFSAAMLYSVEDPSAFARAVRDWLHPQGLWVIQVSYLPATLATNNFGDVVHEHVGYFTLDSLRRLLEPVGLRIEAYSFNDVNGGSVRVFVRHAGACVEATMPDDELAEGALAGFADRVERLKHDTLETLQDFKRNGVRVLGYGASTKGATMLGYYGIGPNLLPAIADRNPAKWGKFTPQGIPIIGEDQARAQHPDVFFVLPWHFLDAFKEREMVFLRHGGRFLIPLPELRLEPPFTAASRPVIGREEVRHPDVLKASLTA
jgi:hypothetical protein